MSLQWMKIYWRRESVAVIRIRWPIGTVQANGVVMY